MQCQIGKQTTDSQRVCLPVSMALMGMSILKEPMSMMHIILNNVEIHNKRVPPL